MQQNCSDLLQCNPALTRYMHLWMGIEQCKHIHTKTNESIWKNILVYFQHKKCNTNETEIWQLGGKALKTMTGTLIKLNLHWQFGYFPLPHGCNRRQIYMMEAFLLFNCNQVCGHTKKLTTLKPQYGIKMQLKSQHLCRTFICSLLHILVLQCPGKKFASLANWKLFAFSLSRRSRHLFS